MARLCTPTSLVAVELSQNSSLQREGVRGCAYLQLAGKHASHHAHDHQGRDGGQHHLRSPKHRQAQQEESVRRRVRLR